MRKRSFTEARWTAKQDVVHGLVATARSFDKYFQVIDDAVLANVLVKAARAQRRIIGVFVGQPGWF